jgi:pimeloyl-ACP methyl ester carboxylesterase
VAGIIFESGFSDLVGFAMRRGLAGEVAEADREALCPLQKLARSPLPLLVLHGEEDSLIPAAEGRAAHAASASPHKQLALIPGRGHNDLSLDPRYWSALKAFVERVAQDVATGLSEG